MKLRKVISGGQTGADRTGLEEAHELGLETGGFAPRGYRTESGSDKSLQAFGLEETAGSDYPTRTRLNVQHSDCTLWFGNVGSPGYKCTANACKLYNKPMLINPTERDLRILAEEHEVWNIAGNRESTNPDVVAMVQLAFRVVRAYVASNKE